MTKAILCDKINLYFLPKGEKIMQRYCPICGETLPQNSRLCPNCDKDKIRAQQLNRQARAGKTEALSAPAPYEPQKVETRKPPRKYDEPEKKKSRLPIIIVSAVLGAVLVVGGAFLVLNMLRSKNNVAVQESREAANDFFSENIAPAYAAQGEIALRYELIKNEFCLSMDDNEDFLLDYAVADFNGDDYCDLMTVKLAKNGGADDLGLSPVKLLYEYYYYNSDDEQHFDGVSDKQTKKLGDFVDTKYNTICFGSFYSEDGDSPIDVRLVEDDYEKTAEFTCDEETFRMKLDKAKNKVEFYVDGEDAVSVDDFNVFLADNGLSKYEVKNDEFPEFFEKSAADEYYFVTVNRTADSDGVKKLIFSGCIGFESEQPKTEPITTEPKSDAATKDEAAETQQASAL